MKRMMSLLAISLISTNAGCTLCSDCDDYSYGAFGGRWERSDLNYGRVGSAFSPEGSTISDGELIDPHNLESMAPEVAAPDAEVVPPPSDDEPPSSDAEEDSLLDT
ncbi:MAG: hypothetical protein QGH33_06585 [Pirellulaceae bacterium]|jgi:hypothetical protein|nr:hypothetical protein [Pirellulaceae bacterium]HJN09498.1 hypothetical protein [Pirellulaceae bacterium]